MSAVSESINTLSLREKIVQRIDAGRLPIADDNKIFGGYGRDQTCDCCDSRIPETDVLYEVELTERQPPLILSMHRLCFNVWMEESELRQSCSAGEKP